MGAWSGDGSASSPYPGLPARVVLASGSPRRRELLGLLGIEFEVVSPDIDETPHDHESAAELVARLAAAKALAVATARDVGDDAVVIAADTEVTLGGRVFGKPADADAARRMLRELSGRRHDVVTGVALSGGGVEVETFVVTTAVWMAELSDPVVDWYVGTGEPFDKAGAYALQGFGATLVERIEGSTTNVIGLPMAELAQALAIRGSRPAGRRLTSC